MKIFHPLHATAWSIRTSGFPILAVGEGGKILARLRSQKQAGYIEVPDGTSYLLHLYWTGSGRLVLYRYRPEDGLPQIGEAFEVTHGLPDWLEGEAREYVVRAISPLPDP